MASFFRKTLTGAATAVSLGALVASGTPVWAQWRGGHGHGGWGPGIAAGVIGGLAVGAIVAGSANRAYASPAPAYEDPVYPQVYPGRGFSDEGHYAPEPAGYCHREWRPVYRTDGQYVRDRLVRVCD